MTKINGKYEKYLCDFCEESEMFSHHETWECLEDGRDCCIYCLIQIKNEAIEALKEANSAIAEDFIARHKL